MNLVIGVLGHTFSVLRGYDDNAIDGWLFRKFQSLWLLRIQDKHKHFWRPILEKVVLLLSDYQLLFGLAILIAGLWKHCSISAYHFSLVVDLAWFANTHLTSLSILRCYLQERPSLRNWRVCIMALMMAMMLVAFALASTPDWDTGLSCPAQCLFDDGNRNLALTSPFMVALLIHYSTSIWRVYDTQRFDRYFLQYPRDKLQKMMRSAQRTNSNLSSMSNRRQQTAGVGVIALQSLLALSIWLYLAIAAALGSLTMSLYYDVCWFVLGFMGILYTRKIPGSDMDGDENKLTFGQIVPVLLLASILLTFKGVYTGKSHLPVEERHANGTAFSLEQKFKSDAEAANPSFYPGRPLSRHVELYPVDPNIQPGREDPEVGLGQSRIPIRPLNEKAVVLP